MVFSIMALYIKERLCGLRKILRQCITKCEIPTFGLSFDSTFSLPVTQLPLIKEPINDPNVDYYLDKFEKKGRVKLSHTFEIIEVDPFNDLAKGRIIFVDTGEVSEECIISLAVVDAFFKKVKKTK